MVGFALSLSRSMVTATASAPSCECLRVGCRDQSSCRLLLQNVAAGDGAVAVVVTFFVQGATAKTRTPHQSSVLVIAVSILHRQRQAGHVSSPQRLATPLRRPNGRRQQPSKPLINTDANNFPTNYSLDTGEHSRFVGSTLFTPSARQSLPSASFEYHQEPPASHLLLSLLTPYNPAALTVLLRSFFVMGNSNQGQMQVPDCSSMILSG